MERWTGRVAVVTGASAGIGAAIAKELVKNGMTVVGLARRAEKVDELKNELNGAPGSLHSLKADVSKEEDIIAAFSWIKNNLGGVDVLINNAGIVGTSTLHDGPVSKWRSLFDLNVIGLSLCTKEALQSMNDRGIDDGHIIHISSINGHGVPQHSIEFGLMMYTATKSSVTVLTEGLRRELAEKKSKIRVTAISPGMVWTDIMLASGYKLQEGQTVADIYKDVPHLKAQDIADAVTYVLGCPPHVQIHEIIIKPVGEAF